MAVRAQGDCRARLLESSRRTDAVSKVAVRRVRAGQDRGSAVVDVVTGWSDSIARWVAEVGATRLGLLLALALAGVLTVAFGTRTRRGS